MNLRLGTFCSGIGATEQASIGLPITPVFTSEIEPFPCEVLKVRHPGAINLGDMTKLHDTEIPPVDVVFAGTPCQSFSIAGLRAGMADPRGNLALVFLGLVDRIRPRWLVWENVPGVLSSLSHEAPDPSPPPPPVDLECDGQEVETEDDYGAEELHALNCFVAGLSELGYGWAMRVLDAQYTGVPQRRRRVFVVGHLGDWRRSAAVLFERHSLSGNHSPSRETRQGIASALTRGTEDEKKCFAMRTDQTGSNGLGVSDEVAFTLDQANGQAILHSSLALPILATQGKNDPELENYISQPIPIAYTLTGTNKTKRTAFESDTAGSIRTKPPGSVENSSTTIAATGYGVRRLTPTECARLQGFPDDYCDINFRGKPAKDAPKYRAFGNSMAVPVVRWILDRLCRVDAIRNERL